MWNRIRQFWTDERWIRVTDESEKLQFVGVNVPMKQPAVDPMTGQPAVGPDGQPVMQPVMEPEIDPATRRPAVDPATGQPKMKPVLENKIAEIDIDIIVDMSPEYASLQQEQFATLAELAKSGAVQIPPDVLIEASQLRNKAKLLEKMNDPQAQQQQMQAMQMQMAQLQATIQKLTAEAENKQADTALKTAEAQQIQREAMAPPEVRGPDMGKMADAETKRQKMIVDARLGAERLQIERAKAEAGIRKTQADTAATMVRTQREARTPIADPNNQRGQNAR
jgi:hypothetical protein